MVDPSQSPSPYKVLGFFHSDTVKGNRTNSENHGKADVAMVRQEHLGKLAQPPNRQHRHLAPQASVIAAQRGPEPGLLLELPALIEPPVARR